jgi:RNA polymerase sigma factor (sigma-70 family)
MRPMTDDEKRLAESCIQYVQPSILALCRSYPGIRKQVERIDATAVGYLAVCRAAQTYDPDKSRATTYFSRAIRNAILKEIAKRRRAVCDGPDRVPLTSVEGLVFRHPDQLVSLAVAALPEDAVALIRRRYYDGETLTDMAAQDGCTRSTIRRRLSRALATLRTALETRRGKP